MEKVIVIGSGFGGLAAAIRLQARGFDVSIFEKNELVGGHAYQLKKDGYTFDMGPSLITAPDIIKSVFSAADKRLEDYVDLIKLDPYYRIYFHDGSSLDYSGNSNAMKTQMAQFSPHDVANYDRFMEHCRQSRRRLLLLDYDGTLVPFATLPQDAVPNQPLIRILRDLSDDPCNEVALISGRKPNLRKLLLSTSVD